MADKLGTPPKEGTLLLRQQQVMIPSTGGVA